MTQPSGWYDDPQDPALLRYWDGVVWSDNVTPKVSPTLGQSNIGMPYGVAPAAARPQAPGSHGAQGTPPPPGVYGQQDPGHPGPMPGYGQYPGQQQGWQSNRPSTPDGVALSGWWRRVGARILDGIIVWVVALPLTFAPMRTMSDLLGDWFQQVLDAVDAGSTTTPPVPDGLNGPILQISLTILVVYVIYEVAFLAMTGATPGKRATGISVRLRDRPGVPPLSAVLTRTAVKEGGNLLGIVPIVGAIGSLFGLIDSLWPLWDNQKQAIHDKVGATNVVLGQQPKRTR